METYSKIPFKSSNNNQSVSERTCVRASHACVRKSRCEAGAKLHGIVHANVRASKRSLFGVRACFFGCVTRVRSHLKFFNKMMEKRLKTKVFLCRGGILTFTSEEFHKNNRNNALVFK